MDTNVRGCSEGKNYIILRTIATIDHVSDIQEASRDSLKSDGCQDCSLVIVNLGFKFYVCHHHLEYWPSIVIEASAMPSTYKKDKPWDTDDIDKWKVRHYMFWGDPKLI